jgi:hypothetical protein
VCDFGKRRSLAVDKGKGDAFLLQGANLPQINFYEKIRNLPGDDKALRLPAKKINGKDVIGFKVKLFDHEVTVWADASKRLPVRIEGTEKVGKETGSFILDNIEFDKPLDTKLFSLEPPPGYRLRIEGSDAELPAALTDDRLKNPIVTPLVGIGPAKFGMMREEIEKALGKADAVEAVGKNGFVILKYGSRGFFLHVHPARGLKTVQCYSQKVMAIRIRDFGGKTDKGIQLGSSSADIIKAYGIPEGNESRGPMTDLSYHKLGIEFSLANDKLISMFLTPR